jgi:hypothetical protein
MLDMEILFNPLDTRNQVLEIPFSSAITFAL